MRKILGLAAITVACVLCACAHVYPRAIIRVQAVGYLNPDVHGQPSPVVVTIYQLKSLSTFKTAHYSALLANPGLILGTDLIDKQQFEIRPQERKNIDLNLEDGTRYLAIIAGYRNIDKTTWYQFIAIKKHQKKLCVQLNLESQALHAKSINRKGLIFSFHQ